MLKNKKKLFNLPRRYPFQWSFRGLIKCIITTRFFGSAMGYIRTNGIATDKNFRAGHIGLKFERTIKEKIP